MAGFLSDNFIQRVLDETDIVSLIDSLFHFKRKADHWSLCPFCEDGNNPSSVSARKNNFIIVLDAELQATQ